MALSIVFLSISSAQAGDPIAKCQSAKVKAMGKYVACRTKTEAKAALRGLPIDTAALAKCADKFLSGWGKADTKGAGQCADPPGADETLAEATSTLYTDWAASYVTGGAANICAESCAPCEADLQTCEGDLTTCNAELAACQGNSCGDGVVNAVSEQCDGSDLDGSSCVALSHGGGTLACTGGCRFDANGCTKCPDGALEFEDNCWFLGLAGQSCDAVCSSNGMLYDSATDTVAGSTGTSTACFDLLGSLGAPAGPNQSSTCGGGFGCFANVSLFPARVHCTAPPTTSSAIFADGARACACR